MKRKDFILIIISVAILAVAGYLAWGQLMPSKGTTSSSSLHVESVPMLIDSFNADTLKLLSDPTKVRDFSPSIDITTGLDNPAPFGPF